jgi:hypothetical protein
MRDNIDTVGKIPLALLSFDDMMARDDHPMTAPLVATVGQPIRLGAPEKFIDLAVMWHHQRPQSRI